MKNRNLVHSDNWETPKELYDKLNQEFNFNFDPCPINHNTDNWNGLEIEWKERKLKEQFVKKAIQESKKGKLCVLLLPVSTSTKLFHDFILPHKKEIRFLKGRVKFIGYNTFGKKVTNKAGMHDSMIVILDNETRR